MKAGYERSHISEFGGMSMLKYIVKRILQMIPMLLILTLVVFFMVRLIPGDPVTMSLGMGAGKEAIAAETARLGLDKPIWEQYFIWMGNLVKGDFGTSIFTHKSVLYEITKRFPVTVRLAVGATVVSTVVGVIFGIIASVKRGKAADNILMVTSLLSVSTPSFFLAMILMLIFCLQLRWFPVSGFDTWKHMVLPIITLGTQEVGYITRITRSSMLDVLGEDYIRTSRARGVAEQVIIFSHAFKNAIIPVLTSVGLRFGSLLAGATLTETVFSIAGIGRLTVDAVSQRDYPLIQGCILVLAVTFVVVNTVVDILYTVADPRIKFD
jgi:ABC-type dipeptide/oligopeptide/nickel transport system permease component